MNLSIPRSGAFTTTSVAGTASYVDAAIGTSTGFTPQDLINNLPSTLQPSSTLFYYNPQEEDLLLQQVALQQTGKASFIDGLSYDSQNNLSVTEQEKGILYQNALTYAQTNNLKLGDALSQTQIAALDKPMLWYVEQTVPDPSCTSTGTSVCPTITALMPQIYLPQDTNALQAGGTIAGTDVTLDFNKSGGTVLNTGTIAATGTLTVNTGTLTNQANQVDIGNQWSKVEGGYVDTTGTVVQPGGYMSAANYALNVDKLTQVGGALNLLNADGSVNVAGTTALVTQLQQQLGSNFSQATVADALHTQFVQQGGVPSWFGVVAIAAAIVVSVLTYGAASAAVGAAAGATAGAGTTFAAASAAGAAVSVSAGLGNIVISAAIAGIASSATSQLIMTGSIDAGKLGEAALVSGITAGLLNGITYSSADGLGFTTGSTIAGSGTQSLASLAGLQNLSNAMSPSASGTSASVSTQLAAVAGGAAISAGVQTVVEGGSYLGALKGSLVSSAAAIGAYEIGELSQPGAALEQGSAAYVLAHAALGCAAGAASGTGCEGGALGGATSAIITPLLVNAAGGAASLTSTQRAEIVGLATLLGGTNALLTGVNAVGGATSAENEALNNSTLHSWGGEKHESPLEEAQDEEKKLLDKEKAAFGEEPLTQNADGTVTASGQALLGAGGGIPTGTKGTGSSNATSGTMVTNSGVPSTLSGLANPNSIRFTQSSISSTFSDGSSLQDAIGALLSGVLSPSDLPPIRVYEQNGLTYTLDNRRLFVTSQAGTTVNITPATLQEITSQAWKFTTPNQGCIICIRGAPK